MEWRKGGRSLPAVGGGTPERRGPVARIDRVDDSLDTDRRRVVADGDDDGVSEDRGGRMRAAAAAEQDEPLAGPHVVHASAIDDEQPVRRADELSRIAEQ